MAPRTRMITVFLFLLLASTGWGSGSLQATAAPSTTPLPGTVQFNALQLTVPRASAVRAPTTADGAQPKATIPNARRLPFWLQAPRPDWVAVGPHALPVKDPNLANGATRALDIIGGEEAAPGAWPWQVALVNASVTNAYDGQFCGGSLIAPEWVLTAGHCVEGALPLLINVVTGRHRLSSAEGERIPVAQIIVHRDFDYYNLDSDLALLRLARPSTQQPISLNAPEDSKLEAQAAPATVIGWGIADPYYEPSDTLHQVVIPLVKPADCTAVSDYTGWVKPTMLCAGFDFDAETTKSPCYGDSGGPLMVRNSQDDGWAQLGIVSWGYGCYGYGVFTRVSRFKSWINGCLTDFTTAACQGSGLKGDAAEPDNFAQTEPQFQLVDSVGQEHNIHRPNDDDWTYIDAIAGHTYIIETYDLGKGGDTILWLYATDGFSILAWNDDATNLSQLSYDEYIEGIQTGMMPQWRASRITWNAPADGVYYVQANHYSGYATGPRTQYNIRLVTLGNQVYLPIITGE
ncbi:MAG: serine protease [Caldilineaceae bacterium]